MSLRSRAAPTADLNSLYRAAGRIVLHVTPGRERTALFAATMVCDILGEDVRPAGAPGPPPLLDICVGDVAVQTSGAAPVLRIGTAQRRAAAVVTLTDAPWNQAASPAFRDLGFAAAGSDADEVLVASNQGPVCTRRGNNWTLLADLPEVFGAEVLRHATAEIDVREVLSAQLVLRAILARILPSRTATQRAYSLLTIDAEDQQRYFINREARCSSIRGAPDEDLQFANSCRTIMDRCEKLGVKAVFMVTGDEIDPSFVDAFGDQLIGLDENRRVLDEIDTRGHDVACHGFDHEWWLSNGRSPMKPMSLLQKLRYFFDTSGDIRTLLGLARFLLRYGPQLAAARQKKVRRGLTSGRPFEYQDVIADLDSWARLVGFDQSALFIRYPGYVRSAATIDALDDRFDVTVDSSDLFDPKWGLPVYPFSLIAERAGRLRRTAVREIPCVWIDLLLRTPDPRRVDAQIAELERLAQFPGSFLSFVTHTKVVGSTWGHCHVYLHDPFKGMALPMVQSAWTRFGSFLAERTASVNWRDVRPQFVRAQHG